MFPIALLAALAAGAHARETEIETVTFGIDIPGLHTTGTTTFTITPDHIAARATGGQAGETLTIGPSEPTGTPTRNPSGHTIVDPTKGGIPQNAIFVPSVGIMADGFVGSVKKVDECSTTLVLGCAKTANPNLICGLDIDFKATMTKGPHEIGLRYSTKIDGDKYKGDAHCELLDEAWLPDGSGGLAYCVYSEDGMTMASTQVNTDLAMIPITAGAKKLPTGNAVCTKDGIAAAAPTGVLEIKKIIVPLVLAAGAQALL